MTTFNLPENHEPFTDKYFLRANEILKAENLNPWVRAQVFIRKGPGIIRGIEEAVAILDNYSPLKQHGGNVSALREGAPYHANDTVMVIEAPIQDIIELETMYLGVIAAETTKANDGHGVDLKTAKETMEQVVEAAQGRPVSYFGARHWRYDEDAAIAKAAFDGGATSASTDIAAVQIGQKGKGTIPHALENVYAWLKGYDQAVVESTKAFDRVIDPNVPRIALIDYANREIKDSIATADAFHGRLSVRVDTCGENIAEGASPGEKKYWEGNGVTVTGVKALREALNDIGHEKVNIILTSGFGNPEKVRAFVAAEQELGMRLFDGLGVGGIYPARMTTMDIVAVGETQQTMQPMAKIGRLYRPNPNLELRLD